MVSGVMKGRLNSCHVNTKAGEFNRRTEPSSCQRPRPEAHLNHQHHTFTQNSKLKTKPSTLHNEFSLNPGYLVHPISCTFKPYSPDPYTHIPRTLRPASDHALVALAMSIKSTKMLSALVIPAFPAKE